jgi:hypothetical protein
MNVISPKKYRYFVYLSREKRKALDLFIKIFFIEKWSLNMSLNSLFIDCTPAKHHLTCVRDPIFLI